MQRNPKICNVLNVRRGVLIDVPEGFKSGEMIIDSLKEDTTYGSQEHRNGYFKKKSWFWSVLPIPTGRTLGYLVEPTVRHTEFKRPVIRTGRGPAEPAGMLRVAEELGYGASSHYCGDARTL